MPETTPAPPARADPEAAARTALQRAYPDAELLAFHPVPHRPGGAVLGYVAWSQRAHPFRRPQPGEPTREYGTHMVADAGDGRPYLAYGRFGLADADEARANAADRAKEASA